MKFNNIIADEELVSTKKASWCLGKVASGVELYLNGELILDIDNEGDVTLWARDLRSYGFTVDII